MPIGTNVYVLVRMCVTTFDEKAVYYHVPVHCVYFLLRRYLFAQTPTLVDKSHLYPSISRPYRFMCIQGTWNVLLNYCINDMT